MAVSAPAQALSNGVDYVALARARLRPCELDAAEAAEPRAGDHVLNPGHIVIAEALRAARPAAVLIPLVARPEGTTVLLTERASSLRSHSGQIAFPGGKIDGPDETPVEAALREAEEEIGLHASRVEPFGRLDSYLSGSGFRIVPIVAEVRAPFSLTPNPAEVADVFEVPLAFLMDEANHQRQSRVWQGLERHYYEMPWESRRIWGVTAGILRNFYERLAS